MRIFKCCQSLIVILTLIPTVLLGFDFPGYATYHGKVIDADTLEPIEGAVVYAIWMKCRPGIGSGSCGTGPVKEVLTDAEGEWKITGPKGNDDPGYIRSVIGFLVPWIELREIGYYRAGYFPFHKKPGIGDFSAYAYVDKAKEIEGIILYRRNNMEEWERYLELSRMDDFVTLIPVKDPERRLRDLDFNFRYPENVKRVYVPVDLTQYKVVGLKRAVTPAEKREARRLGSNGFYPNARQPLLGKALEYQYDIEGRRYNDVQE
ncbi:MAG: hypothetical protein RBT82_14700 [Desulfomonilia bacterium]|jgi:hypothetical protein|nr:hypothetical protein [Desulfomonilia bacterium]